MFSSKLLWKYVWRVLQVWLWARAFGRRLAFRSITTTKERYFSYRSSRHCTRVTSGQCTAYRAAFADVLRRLYLPVYTFKNRQRRHFGRTAERQSSNYKRPIHTFMATYLFCVLFLFRLRPFQNGAGRRLMPRRSRDKTVCFPGERNNEFSPNKTILKI